MRKITIIVFLLIFINSFFTSTNAQNLSEVNFEVLEEQEYIKVIIKTSGSTIGIQGIQGTFEYDKNILEYVENRPLTDNWIISSFNVDTGIFLLELDDITDESTYIYEEKQVAEFTFKLKNKNLTGNTQVSISNIKVVGADSLKQQEVVKTVIINNSKIENVLEETNATNAVENTTIEKLNFTNKQENIVTDKEVLTPSKLPKTGEREIRILLGISLAVSVALYLRYKKC